MRFDRYARVLVALAALSLVVAACSTGGSKAAPAVLDVSLSEFKVAVPELAPEGRPITFRVHNAGSAIHSVAIDVDGKTYETKVLNAGGAASLQVPALAAGRYTMWCTVPSHREAGMETTLVVGSGDGTTTTEHGMSAAEIDAAHEKGVKAFPATTSATGGQILEPTIENGVKVFRLTADTVKWEVDPGRFVEAFAYNGQVPGPELRVKRGDRVRVELMNELPESTSIHWHGLTVPNAMDGVPYLTQAPVKPGERFTYAFTVRDDPGTFMYHSHHNALAQVGKGLYGAIIVEPPTPIADVEATLFVGDGEMGYTLNGKGFPATAPLSAKKGQTVLLRFANAGQQLHPMHQHGFHFTVIARDGQKERFPYTADTLVVAPGERYDVLFEADLPGVWALHCHILSHAESEHGMHGMVTALIVK